VVAAVAWSLSASLGAVLLTAAFGAAMAYVALVDLRSRRIPNAVTVPGMLLAIALAGSEGTDAMTSALLGAGLALLLTGAMYALARGQFGMGDVKLAGLGGAVLGLPVVPAFLVVASLLASVAAIVVLLRGQDRHATIAYGPYIAAAGVIFCCLSGPVVG
jgi:leader peptidase (prepilin peptidase)/N-methyltransferase